MNNMVGPPVSGDDFYNRESEIASLTEMIETDHILLLAPRRVGKTSLMRKLAERAGDAKTFVPVFMIAGGEGDTEATFVERLYRSVGLTRDGKAVLKQLRKGRWGSAFDALKDLKSFSIGGVLSVELGERREASWKAAGDALVDALAATSRRWLLQVDELPLFILNLLRNDNGHSRTRAFLEWFRNARQMADGQGHNLRWMMAGSIGLDTVTERLALGPTINDLRPQGLGPFSRETADAFLETLGLCYDIPLNAAVRQEGLDRVGWLIPYHLQVVFSELRNWVREHRREPDAHAVGQVFETLMSPTRSAYFDAWDQRLGEELGRPVAEVARRVLLACARDPRGASRAVLDQTVMGLLPQSSDRADTVRWLVHVLSNDGYLVKEQGRFAFRSPLLRRYWVEKYAP